MDGVEIIEAAVVVRPWTPADADAACRACQDPDIQRWTTVARPYLREHAEAFVTSVSARFTVEGVVRASVNQRGVPHDAWGGALLATDPAA